LPSVLTHSEALESNSLFCTMYVPPEAVAVCSWQSVLVAACAPAVLSASAVPPPITTARPAMAASTAFRRGLLALRGRIGLSGMSGLLTST
jgi:hypothetical protein